VTAEKQGFWIDCDIAGSPNDVISQIKRKDEAMGGID